MFKNSEKDDSGLLEGIFQTFKKCFFLSQQPLGQLVSPAAEKAENVFVVDGGLDE